MQIKKSAAIILFISIAISISAQQHNNYWIKGTVIYALSKKLDAGIEIHHRTQNDLDQNSPFGKPLMNAVRSLLIYKPYTHIKMIYSPLAYFENYKIIQHTEDILKAPRKEWRMYIAGEFQQPLLHQLTVMSRTGVEYRMMEGLPNTWRWRNRIDATLYIAKYLTMTIGDELMVNVKDADDAHFFDQNRVIFNTQIIINKKLKLEMGYIYNSRFMSQSLDHITENNVTSGIIYTFNKFLP